MWIFEVFGHTFLQPFKLTKKAIVNYVDWSLVPNLLYIGSSNDATIKIRDLISNSDLTSPICPKF